MANEELAARIAAAKDKLPATSTEQAGGEGVKSSDLAVDNAELANELEEVRRTEIENLVPQYGSTIAHPLPPIIMEEPTEEEKAAALAEHNDRVNANKPVGLYAHLVGALYGNDGLVKLSPTPYGNFQTVSAAEATGTVESWQQLILSGQAYEVE